jgi:hypothetical protein
VFRMSGYGSSVDFSSIKGGRRAAFQGSAIDWAVRKQFGSIIILEAAGVARRSATGPRYSMGDGVELDRWQRQTNVVGRHSAGELVTAAGYPHWRQRPKVPLCEPELRRDP